MILTEGRFWDNLFHVNAEISIFHQWEQLEATGCIQNFRIAAGLEKGFREGYFFADSDAYKWLEAASLLLDCQKDTRLNKLVDEFISILEKAQEEDGYLYTYNQVHFSGVRWKNLQLEHEFYCLGHLIEAGIAHHRATGEPRLLVIARRAADLLVREFLHAAPAMTDGHEEIEIALIRLSLHTGTSVYRDLARHFLSVRGRVRGYGFLMLSQTLSMIGRMRTVRALREKYARTSAGYQPVKLPAHNTHITPPLTPLRFLSSLLSGKYVQQHTSLQQQDVPVGHAVRFSYLQTARAMLLRDEPEQAETACLEYAWERMTARRMYLTGGIGSLPLIEGFGRDYELDPQVAYAETCAALGNMLWNKEMSRLTGKPRYADLMEWQFYNAARVGVSLDGKSYFYNNPLVCQKAHQRAEWYHIPCCPSNLSRVIASLPEAAIQVEGDRLVIDQYVPVVTALGGDGNLTLTTSLPWEGDVQLVFSLPKPARYKLKIRVPAWAGKFSVRLNGKEIDSGGIAPCEKQLESAVGLHFEDAIYWQTEKVFQDGDNLSLRFSMPFVFRKQDTRLPGCGGKVALTRGPLVYCLESIDQQVDLFNLQIDADSLSTHFDPDLLGGSQVITGRSKTGEALTWVPYMLWGNRGESRMTMFFDV